MLLQQGDYVEAVHHYSRAVDIDPNDLSSYFHRGIAYNELDEPALALADFHRVLERAPNHIPARFKTAEIYVKQKHLKDALAVYHDIIKLNLVEKEAYYQRSFIYRELGDYKKAFEDAMTARLLGHEVNPQYLKELKVLIKGMNPKAILGPYSPQQVAGY